MQSAKTDVAPTDNVNIRGNFHKPFMVDLLSRKFIALLYLCNQSPTEFSSIALNRRQFCGDVRSMRMNFSYFADKSVLMAQKVIITERGNFIVL
jgi:hypothetical protein